MTSISVHAKAAPGEQRRGVAVAARQLLIGLTATGALLAAVSLTAATEFGAASSSHGAVPEPAPAPRALGHGAAAATPAPGALEQPTRRPSGATRARSVFDQGHARSFPDNLDLHAGHVNRLQLEGGS